MPISIQILAAGLTAWSPAQGDACSLLAQVEAETIPGRKIKAPAKGGHGECQYADGELLVDPMMLGFKSPEE